MTRSAAIKSIVAKPIRHMLHQAGLELRPKSKAEVETPTLELSAPCDALYQHGDVAFSLPLSHCMYPYLLSYGPEGWHPFVEVLRAYQENPQLSYKDSVLHDYYQRCQPKSVLDVFFPKDEQTPELLASAFARLEIPPHNPTFPWDPAEAYNEGEAGLDASHGNQGFGPVSDAKGELEFRRLTLTLESIKLHGYRPKKGGDGDIRGYLLRGPSGYRFVVRQGFHRTAVLAALGFDKIRVRFYGPYPRCIFLHDVENWPLVKQGKLGVGTATRIFEKFFEEDGSSRARALGLSPDG